MENFLQDKDIWIVGSVCLLASFLWGRFWNLLTRKRKRENSDNTSADVHTQVTENDATEKSKLNLKGLKPQKKKKPPDAVGEPTESVQAGGLEEVQTLNQQNAQCFHDNADSSPEASELPDAFEVEDVKVTEKGAYQDREVEDLQVTVIDEDRGELLSVETYGEGQKPERVSAQKQVVKEEEDDTVKEKEEEIPPAESEIPSRAPECTGAQEQLVKEEEDDTIEEKEEEISPAESELPSTYPTMEPNSSEGAEEVVVSTKRRISEEDKDDQKKSRVEEPAETQESTEEAEDAELQGATGGPEEEEREEEEKAAEKSAEEYFIDCSPPPPAPFDHRVVTAKTHQISSYYTINREEVLGGGRFGMVHKCVEKSSGLVLAAKIIKARSKKEKEVVKSEIEIMNQLSHASLIQLYAAFESRYDITLVMEYVEGGELFDRIIDENYKLTELDTVTFIRQITEGLQFMHKMYILHLDLKPENIMCVSRETNKIKIIDFGLARRYKPREKLRVNFGTPEFLAPEVINYDFVSFPTDMWSLGVITYMLLSGLSPFLGDDDNETLNNILACQWGFEEEEFADISDEAKDFITLLLVKSKCWRMSASQSLKHPWLSNPVLHFHLHEKQNKCHSSHAPPPES